MLDSLSAAVSSGELPLATYNKLVLAVGAELEGLAQKQEASEEVAAVESASPLLNRAVELARQAGVAVEDVLVVAAAEASRLQGATRESVSAALDVPALQDVDPEVR